MKKRKKALRISAAIALAALLVTSCAPQAGVATDSDNSLSTDVAPASDVALESTLAQKADKIAQSLVYDYSVSSVQYAIIDNGEIILSGNSGSYERGSDTPITPNTMYGIGSTSKMFTVAAAMMLAEEGKVDLDKPVVTYILEFTMKDERYKQITPRMLMNYSSGLHGTSSKNVFLFDTVITAAHDQLLDDLAQQTLKSTPGEFSTYNNDGITLLEILVERVTGQDFSTFFAEQISEPLGLQYTKSPQDNFDRNLLAKTYHPISEEALPVDTVNIVGSGGYYSTAEDLCRISQILMGQKPEILSMASAQAMSAEEYRKGLWGEQDESIFAYGLGWDSVHTPPFETYGIQAVAKGGNTVLYHSELVVIPEHNLSMAVLSSGGTAFFNNAFASTILQEVLKEKGVIDAIAPLRTIAKPVKQEMPKDMEQFNGLYSSALMKPFEIEIKDGTFTYVDDMVGLPTSSGFVYTGEGRFTNGDGSMIATFETLENGRTYLLIDHSLPLQNLGLTNLTYTVGQKLEDDPMSEDLANVWKSREGRYYILDDNPNSHIYLGKLFDFFLSVETDSSYASGCKIIDENHAVNNIIVPMMHITCDSSDLEFYTKDDVEYLEAKGYTLIGEKDIETLDTGIDTYTIGEDGFGKWYSIPDTAVGQQIQVELPENASFAVYDENFKCIFFSPMTAKRSTILPQNGKIVFFGTAGDTFHLYLRS